MKERAAILGGPSRQTKGVCRSALSLKRRASSPSDEKVEIESLVSSIFRYRHLLMNLSSHYRKSTSGVKGPRAAAVLARLWANEDLQLHSTSQKVIGLDLGIGASELGKILADLRRPVINDEGCVKQVSDQWRRERIYAITAVGKQELEKWLLVSYGPRPFIEFMKKISPSPKKVADLLDNLKQAIRHELGR